MVDGWTPRSAITLRFNGSDRLTRRPSIRAVDLAELVHEFPCLTGDDLAAFLLDRRERLLEILR